MNMFYLDLICNQHDINHKKKKKTLVKQSKVAFYISVPIKIPPYISVSIRSPPFHQCHYQIFHFH